MNKNKIVNFNNYNYIKYNKMYNMTIINIYIYKKLKIYKQNKNILLIYK